MKKAATGYMNYNGWSRLLEFYAPKCGTPGTQRFAVHYATGPWRVWVKPMQSGWTGNGWSPHFDFCAFPDDLEYAGIKFNINRSALGPKKPR